MDKKQNLIDSIVINNHSLLNKTPDGESSYVQQTYIQRNKVPSSRYGNSKVQDKTNFIDYDDKSEIGVNRNKTPENQSLFDIVKVDNILKNDVIYTNTKVDNILKNEVI
jgi:hypothetical protein